MTKIKMLYSDGIGVSKGIYVNKNKYIKRMQLFVTMGIFQINLQPYVCNGCHDLFMMFMSISKIKIYCCIISEISRNEAIKWLNIDLTEKLDRYKILNVKSNFEAVNFLQILI